MASAVQQAPKTGAPKGSAGKAGKTTQDKRIKDRLHDIPQAAGIAIMAVLLIVSLFVGNARALMGATPKDFLAQGDVKSIVEDRLHAAGNAKTVAMRAQIDALLIEPVDNAINAMESAKSAREISRADQTLTAAVSEMTAAAMDKLDAENRAMLQSAADDFAEQGSFLRQEAKAFNKDAQKAEQLYEKLPTKFVLAEPDVYEGI